MTIIEMLESGSTILGEGFSVIEKEVWDLNLFEENPKLSNCFSYLSNEKEL